MQVTVTDIEKIINDERTRGLDLQLGKKPFNTLRENGNNYECDVEYEEITEEALMEILRFMAEKFNIEIRDDAITYGKLPTSYGEERITILPSICSPSGAAVRYRKIVINKERAINYLLGCTECSLEQIKELETKKENTIIIKISDIEKVEDSKSELDIFFKIYNYELEIVQDHLLLKKCG